MGYSADETDYIEDVIGRARQLIRVGVWNGMSEGRLDGWLGSLEILGAQLLSAYLLDTLCFRSRDQYLALLDNLFENLVVPAPDDPKLNVPLIDGLKLSKIKNPKCAVRIVPVLSADASPTKSGPYILRLAQRQYRLHDDWLCWAHQLHDVREIEELYFLDDFCGTGKQFDSFLKSISFADIMNKLGQPRVTYLVTTVHTIGLNYIREKYPNMRLIWSEQLTASHAVLSKDGLARYTVPGFSKKVSEEYERVVAKSGLPSTGKLVNGFGALGLAYGFAHATPNNTLPIYWMETPHLTPLLDR